MRSKSTTLYYIHDPMCSWCWGYKPTFERLVKDLPETVKLEYLVGGLAPDSDEVMSVELREAIPGYWRKIQDLFGTEFNFDFWQKCEPRRSTYPACRAVLAAKLQGKEVEMLDAIQHAYYLRAMNPSDSATHVQLAKELGINVEQFEKDLHSDAIEAKLQKQIQRARHLLVRGFPSLVLKTETGYHSIPVDYKNENNTLKLINELV